MTDPKHLDKLRVMLCLVAESYAVFVKDASADVGLDIQPSVRANWIDNKLIQPADLLIKALDRLNDRHFSEWPGDEIEFLDKFIDPPQWWVDLARTQGWQSVGPSLRELGPRTYRELWIAELNRLMAWAENKKAGFEGARTGKKPRTHYREELVYDLLLVYVDVTDRKPTRASHGPRDKGKREGRSRIQSVFAEFVRAAAEPVLGRYDNLDNQIQKAIQRYKNEKTELWMRAHFFI
jgi:hypothetical protein